MSLQPQEEFRIPDQTRCLALAAFPKGCACLRVGDVLGCVYQDKQFASLFQPRLRREAYGELIQIDGSEHRWFEDRGAPRSLLVFIDDATGSIPAASRARRFVGT
jgi:hypothetical protein